jgi:hypothetical protein
MKRKQKGWGKMSTNESSNNSSPVVSKSEVTVKTPMSSFVKGGFGFGCGCLLFALFVFIFLPAACTVGTTAIAVPAFKDAAKKAKQQQAVAANEKNNSAIETSASIASSKYINTTTSPSINNVKTTSNSVALQIATPAPTPYVYSEEETIAYKSWYNSAQYWAQKYKEAKTTSEQAEANKQYSIAYNNCDRIKNGQYQQMVTEAKIFNEQQEKNAQYAKIYDAVQAGASTGLITKIENRMNSNAIYLIQVNGFLWRALDLDTKKNVIAAHAIYSILLEGKDPKINMASSFEMVDNKSGQILGGYSTWSGVYIGSK